MTTANKITLVRVFLIPVFLVLCLVEFPFHNLAAAAVFALASITDFIDGYVARKYNQITTFGKFVDPLADKLLVISAFLVFTAGGIMHPVFTFIIVGRELVITSLRILAMGEGVVMAAGLSGKIKTFTQMVIILLIFVLSDLLPLFGADAALPAILTVLSALAAAVTLWSGIDYLWRSRALIMRSK
ncbi:MAG: CDP-diacylglycerol--glycerol-3-phosphate 3-phosphatidyltransferase [Clostridia bacterium]|nr:CDP-diacylglycerol--glycerol-3-phosphate 3-phosphatidyltransferase [Clostridia bacterium]